MKGKKGMPSDSIPFDPHTLTAYRKLALHKEKIEEYYEKMRKKIGVSLKE